jgi:hypothetical protein
MFFHDVKKPDIGKKGLLLLFKWGGEKFYIHQSFIYELKNLLGLVDILPGH